MWKAVSSTLRTAAVASKSPLPLLEVWRNNALGKTLTELNIEEHGQTGK